MGVFFIDSCFKEWRPIESTSQDSSLLHGNRIFVNSPPQQCYFISVTAPSSTITRQISRVNNAIVKNNSLASQLVYCSKSVDQGLGMHPNCVCNLLLRQWLHRRGVLPRIRLRNRLILQVSRYCLIILQLIFIRPKFGGF